MWRLTGESFGNAACDSPPASTHIVAGKWSGDHIGLISQRAGSDSRSATISFGGYNPLRKLVAALLCAALLFPIITAPVRGDGLGGDCTRASVTWWENRDRTGRSARYCWRGVGTGDANMESYIEGYPNLGILYNETYKYDFDPSQFSSGISAVTFYDNTNDGVESNVCFYQVKNFVPDGLDAGFIYATGNYDLGNFAKVGSFKWTTVTRKADC